MHVAIVAPRTREWRSRAPSRETELTRRLAERQARAGHDVTVFCTQFWDGYASTLRREGVAYRAVTVAPAVTSFAARLPVLLAAAQPDAVHATPTPPSAVLAARQGARLAKAPLVVGWEGHEYPSGRLVGRAAEAPDAVVVPSGLVGTRARKAGTPERRVRTIPQAIDFDRVEAVAPAGSYDVVTATPLDEHANLDGLALALAELRRRDWSALVVGDGTATSTDAADASAAVRDAPRVDGGPDREAADASETGTADGDAGADVDEGEDEASGTGRGDADADRLSPRAAIEEQLADLRIDDRVTVVDGMDRDDRLAHYRGAHVFVQTRAQEVFARELLWALACGCVGIVEYQAYSSAHELLEGHERGFRVTTPEEIQDAIEQAGELERWDVAPEMRRYDWERIVEEYVECYREAGRS